MPSAAPARADILGNFQAFEGVILVAGPQTFRKGQEQGSARHGGDSLVHKGETLTWTELGQEQFTVSSIRIAIPDPTSVLSTAGHRQRTACTRLGSDCCGTPSTAQLGIAVQPAKPHLGSCGAKLPSSHGHYQPLTALNSLT